MKKIILSLTALLALCGSMAAQDTVWNTDLKADYFQCEGSWYDTDTGVVSVGGSATYTIIGKYFMTKDSLVVYGIAAMLDKPEFSQEYLNSWGHTLATYMVDTTLDNAFEYVALYDAGPDSLLPLSEQKRIHLKDSVPSYYFGTRWIYPWRDYRVTEVHGVYEVYFDDPIMVSDSFYVGMTHKSWVGFDGIDAPRDSLGRAWSAWPIGPVWYVPEATRYAPDSTIRLTWIEPQEHNQLYSPRRGWVHEYYGSRAFLFPILTPKPSSEDTTTVDTVGISVQLLERYIGVQPNPAAERVLVTSSFGLRSIALYNATGIKVQERKATGYSATLDIRELPEGTYLVRVATPSGTVTKKLVVQRR